MIKRVAVEVGERFGRECRLVRAAGQRQVHLGGSLAQQTHHLDAIAQKFQRRGGDFCPHQHCKRFNRDTAGLVGPRQRALEEEAQVVHDVVPAGRLQRHPALQDSERRRLLAGAAVFQPSGHARGVLEAGLLRQELLHLQLRAGPIFHLAEQLQEEPVAKRERGMVVIPAYRVRLKLRPVAAPDVAKCGRMGRRHLAYAALGAPPLGDGIQQRNPEQPVAQSAVQNTSTAIRVSQARQHEFRETLRHLVGFRPLRDRERQRVKVRLALVVLDAQQQNIRCAFRQADHVHHIDQPYRSRQTQVPAPLPQECRHYAHQLGFQLRRKNVFPGAHFKFRRAGRGGCRFQCFI